MYHPKPSFAKSFIGLFLSPIDACDQLITLDEKPHSLKIL